MKKIWGIWFTILGMLLFFSTATTVKADGNFKVEKYHATADIQKNGDIDLTQRINYQFNGNFHGVYYNQNINAAQSVTDPQVFIDNGRKTTQLKPSTSGENDTFKVTKSKNNMDIKVYHAAQKENVTFIYKYRLNQVVTNYSDTAELNWKMIGSGWENSLHNVVLTVNLPAKNVSKLQAWAHSTNRDGYTHVYRKKGQVKMTLGYLAPYGHVETHMLFPTTVTPNNPNVVNKKHKQSAIAHEQGLVKEANMSRTHQKWTYIYLMVFGAAVILVIYLYRLYDFVKNPSRKHTIPTPLHHTFDEPNFKPSFAKIILDKKDKADNLSLTADLLNEVGKRHLKIEKFGSTYEIVKLTPPTNTFFRYLIDEVGDGKKVNLRQIKSSAKGYGTNRKMLRKFNDWAEEAAKGREKYLDLDNLNFVDNYRISAIASSIITFFMFVIGLIFGKNLWINSGLSLLFIGLYWLIYWVIKKKVTVYTDLGEIEVNKIRAFKRMLTDIDDIKMAEVGDLILWEQFLPYAVVFGVSDKVIKALKVNFGKEQINNSIVASYYIGSTSFINVGSVGFQAAFSGAIGAGGTSSLSGGSGGFTGGSSGGFGGGSGGGAF